MKNKNDNDEEINYNVESDENELNVDGNKTTPSFVPKRNDLLLRFFKEIVFPDHDIMLLGDENSPAIIIDNQYVLSCYVKNFFINFMDKSWDSNLVFSVKLNDSLKKENYDIEEIRNWYKTYEHRKVFKVLLNAQPLLFLVGWNYKDSENKEGKYPVFGGYKPKLYLSVERANEVEKELSDNGYSVKIV